jgi:hypothetical protein
MVPQRVFILIIEKSQLGLSFQKFFDGSYRTDQVITRYLRGAFNTIIRQLSPMPQAERLNLKPASSKTHCYRVSPLISVSIFSLYIVLMLPLPVLAQVTGAGIPSGWWIVGIGLGAFALGCSLSEQVHVNAQGIALVYPAWLPKWYRCGWALEWSEIQKLQPRSTGQGGLVYYLVTHSGQAYLLPSRILGFAQMVAQIGEHTGFETSLVRPLAQPWMYMLLACAALCMGLVDIWVLATAWSGDFPLSTMG